MGKHISGCSRKGCAAKWVPLVATDPAVKNLHACCGYEVARVRAEATVAAKAGTTVLMLYEPQATRSLFLRLECADDVRGGKLDCKHEDKPEPERPAAGMKQGRQSGRRA